MSSVGGQANYQPERELSFSQAQGYEELPGPLKLEELPHTARVHIWNVVYSSIRKRVQRGNFGLVVSGDWYRVLHAKHKLHDNLPLDEWDNSFDRHKRVLRHSIESLPFNRVFDLIQFLLRQPECPPNLVVELKQTFEFCRLAYAIDVTPPPTIIPAVTDVEGKTITESLQTLRQAGLGSSASHLRKAAEYINTTDWAASVRESINAVESVARRLDPQASGSLTSALASLEKRQTLHPALKEAFRKLYGYTSNEQGIRHALLDRSEANVGMDEAVFMLGACASFTSYLWRKHASGASL